MARIRDVSIMIINSVVGAHHAFMTKGRSTLSVIRNIQSCPMLLLPSIFIR